ncbi:MAG: hypothetical protein KBB11_03930 [Bacteroidales bacterium]|nr:hypothetical protein [Bacteroidales bacterium]HOY39778.1 hypothetical protein [Bacteroidales bacterium]HQP03882.1 hypothetical protein [Bacteroidales bacterium]
MKYWMFVLMLVFASVCFGQSLSLEKSHFKPGETIKLSFTALSSYESNAWIGIVPSSIAHGSEDVNDQHDITYQYLNGKTSGVLSFTAPAAEGNYDFRLHNSDNNGKEVAYFSFTVSTTDFVATETFRNASMHLEKLVFSPGEKINLYYTAPPFTGSNPWIGIVPSDKPHGSETQNDQYDISYQYIGSKTSGTLSFTAPTTPGNYSFRMHDTDANGKEVSNISFTVK